MVLPALSLETLVSDKRMNVRDLCLAVCVGAVYTKAVCRRGMAKARTRFESREGRETGSAGASPFLTAPSVHGKEADDVQERVTGTVASPSRASGWRFHDVDGSTAFVIT